MQQLAVEQRYQAQQAVAEEEEEEEHRREGQHTQQHRQQQQHLQQGEQHDNACQEAIVQGSKASCVDDEEWEQSEEKEDDEAERDYIPLIPTENLLQGDEPGQQQQQQQEHEEQPPQPQQQLQQQQDGMQALSHALPVQQQLPLPQQRQQHQQEDALVPPASPPDQRLPAQRQQQGRVASAYPSLLPHQLEQQQQPETQPQPQQQQQAACVPPSPLPAFSPELAPQGPPRRSWLHQESLSLFTLATPIQRRTGHSAVGGVSEEGSVGSGGGLVGLEGLLSKAGEGSLSLLAGGSLAEDLLSDLERGQVGGERSCVEAIWGGGGAGGGGDAAGEPGRGAEDEGSGAEGGEWRPQREQQPKQEQRPQQEQEQQQEQQPQQEQQRPEQQPQEQQPQEQQQEQQQKQRDLSGGLWLDHNAQPTTGVLGKQQEEGAVKEEQHGVGYAKADAHLDAAVKAAGVRSSHASDLLTQLLTDSGSSSASGSVSGEDATDRDGATSSLQIRSRPDRDQIGAAEEACRSFGEAGEHAACGSEMGTIEWDVGRSLNQQPPLPMDLSPLPQQSAAGPRIAGRGYAAAALLSHSRTLKLFGGGGSCEAALVEAATAEGGSFQVGGLLTEAELAQLLRFSLVEGLYEDAARTAGATICGSMSMHRDDVVQQLKPQSPLPDAQEAAGQGQQRVQAQLPEATLAAAQQPWVHGQQLKSQSPPGQGQQKEQAQVQQPPLHLQPTEPMLQSLLQGAPQQLEVQSHEQQLELRSLPQAAAAAPAAAAARVAPSAAAAPAPAAAAATASTQPHAPAAADPAPTLVGEGTSSSACSNSPRDSSCSIAESSGSVPNIAWITNPVAALPEARASIPAESPPLSTFPSAPSAPAAAPSVAAAEMSAAAAAVAREAVQGATHVSHTSTSGSLGQPPDGQGMLTKTPTPLQHTQAAAQHMQVEPHTQAAAPPVALVVRSSTRQRSMTCAGVPLPPPGTQLASLTGELAARLRVATAGASGEGGMRAPAATTLAYASPALQAGGGWVHVEDRESHALQDRESHQSGGAAGSSCSGHARGAASEDDCCVRREALGSSGDREIHSVNLHGASISSQIANGGMQLSQRGPTHHHQQQHQKALDRRHLQRASVAAGGQGESLGAQLLRLQQQQEQPEQQPLSPEPRGLEGSGEVAATAAAAGTPSGSPAVQRLLCKVRQRQAVQLHGAASLGLVVAPEDDGGPGGWISNVGWARPNNLQGTDVLRIQETAVSVDSAWGRCLLFGATKANIRHCVGG